MMGGGGEGEATYLPCRITHIGGRSTFSPVECQDLEEGGKSMWGLLAYLELLEAVDHSSEAQICASSYCWW